MKPALTYWGERIGELRARLMPDGGDGTWSIGWACQIAEAS